jgi:hypothetical protein
MLLRRTLVGAVAAGALLTGCTALAPPATPTAAPKVAASGAPPASVKPAAPPVATAAGGGGNVQQMSQAWEGARSYRLRIAGTRNGAPFDLLQEVVKPDFDRVQVKMGEELREVVRIGRTTYMSANGQWRKFPDPAPNPFLVDPAEIVEDFGAAAKAGGRLTRGGVSTVEGAECQEWTLPANPQSAGGTLCVGLADNLPRRLVVSDNSMTFTFWDWNANIPIEAPPIS